MKKFIIERDLPGAGKLTAAELKAIAGEALVCKDAAAVRSLIGHYLDSLGTRRDPLAATRS